jgi:hypothetical protein
MQFENLETRANAPKKTFLHARFSFRKSLQQASEKTDKMSLELPLLKSVLFNLEKSSRCQGLADCALGLMNVIFWSSDKDSPFITELYPKATSKQQGNNNVNRD